MKVLLDECIDRRLANELSGYEVKTVPAMGWAGLKNGQLLPLAAQEFDVFLTVDRNLPYQQGLTNYNIAVLILRSPTNRLLDLKAFVPNILATLPTAQAGQATTVGG
jgi:hypothetical protein